ncbi:MAG: Spy/CpxP family protein refolding chaperone [Alphaproteobacteria bacterium]
MRYVLDHRDRSAHRAGRPAALRVLAGAILMLSLGAAADSATAQTGNRSAPAQAQSAAGQKPAAGRPAGDPVEAQLGDIKKRLNITAAQQSQFDQFASVVKQNAQAMDSLMQKEAQAAEKSAVEGLRTAATFAQTEADNLKRLLPALEALYASLSDQQKRAADKLFNSAPPAGGPQADPQGKRRG